MLTEIFEYGSDFVSKVSYESKEKYLLKEKIRNIRKRNLKF